MSSETSDLDIRHHRLFVHAKRGWLQVDRWENESCAPGRDESRIVDRHWERQLRAQLAGRAIVQQQPNLRLRGSCQIFQWGVEGEVGVSLDCLVRNGPLRVPRGRMAVGLSRVGVTASDGDAQGSLPVYYC